MAPKMVSFIRNWEVEKYRSSVSLAGAGAKRLSGRIAIVTGGAQGFGYGVAEEMCAEGASVVIADMNAEGAAKAAETLCADFGAGAAFAFGGGREFSEDGGPHQPNEFITCDELLAFTKTIGAYILRTLG